ncbi:MAG TPA: hypothetical protein ENH08_05260, partial [Chromatiales bacterium]|nr:hypothetical protein [Chromatiales bacterium]
MHRSGTSALARVLNLHGVFLGQSLLQADPANERGYWEHDGLWRLDERILAALGREWSDPGRLPERWWERPEVRVLAQELIVTLRRDFGGKALWGVKDPRICRLMPLWHDAVRQLGAREHFVIVLRRPGEVAASLARRDGMPPERARALWLRYMLDAERHTRGASRAFVTYDQLLADWRVALARVVDGTGLDLAAAGAEAATQVDEFLSPQLRHHRVSPGSGTGILAERAEAIYEILAAEGGALDTAALDRAAEELDALEEAFAGGGARTIVPVAEPADRERRISYLEWCNIFGLHESDGQVMAERMMQRWHGQPTVHLIAVLARGEG